MTERDWYRLTARERADALHAALVQLDASAYSVTDVCDVAWRDGGIRLRPGCRRFYLVTPARIAESFMPEAINEPRNVHLAVQREAQRFGLT